MESQARRPNQSRPRRSPSSIEPSATSRPATTASSSSQRNDESWVEISSEPSSSSLSSIGDEIVTTGLRVGTSSSTSTANPSTNTLTSGANSGTASNARRRRSTPIMRYPYHNVSTPGHPNHTLADYEASGSDSEGHLISSGENRAAPPRRSQSSTAIASTRPSAVSFSPLVKVATVPRDEHVATESESESPSDFVESGSDDDDDKTTALGAAPSSSPHIFRPQPNAFNTTSPPAHPLPPRQYSHPHSDIGAARRRSGPPLRSHHRSASSGQSHFRSPAFRIDNDAALRASLNTLLSCARGLGRNDTMTSTGAALGGPPPMDLQIVPESQLMQETDGVNDRDDARANRSMGKQQGSSSSAVATSAATGSLQRRATGERSTRTGKPRAPSPRSHCKKRLTGDAYAISPTVLTWVVSAGVVVLVSVVGFGAGYVIGREVGRQESLAAVAGVGFDSNDAVACGAEVGSGGLKRLRWGTAVKAVVS